MATSAGLSSGHRSGTQVMLQSQNRNAGSADTPSVTVSTTTIERTVHVLPGLRDCHAGRLPYP